MKKRRILVLVFFIFCFFVNIANSKDLYFAGFSFMGNADQDFRYPVAVDMFTKENTVFKEPLDNALKNLNRNDINLIYDLGQISSGEALAISFALTDEVIERFSTKDGITNAYKIFAQILVFDFNEKKVITNFPVLVQNETITSSIPSSEYDYGIFKKMYLDTSFAGSIFNQWIKKLQDVKVLNSSTLHLQLRNVELDTAVLNQIPDALKNKNLLKVRSAQKLEYHISSKQNVPILPFTIGQIGNFKKGLIPRFSDGIVNMIESHILERPKHQNKFPMLSPASPEVGQMLGHMEQKYTWETGHAPNYSTLSGLSNLNCVCDAHHYRKA